MGILNVPTHILLLVLIVIVTTIDSCFSTTTFTGNLIRGNREVGENPAFVSPTVYISDSECVVFQVPFSGGKEVAFKVTLQVSNFISSNPNIDYLAIAAPNWAGKHYNNSIESYQQCSRYFEDETCWPSISHMAHASTNPLCVNSNIARLGSHPFVALDFQDRYSHYVDELIYHGKTELYFLGSDINSCETYGGDYLIFIKGNGRGTAHVQIMVEEESVSMYCWASTPEAWVLMWSIVLLPFIIFAVYFRAKRLREYCKAQVAPDALAVAETNGEETVHPGIPIGSPKPCVVAQVIQRDENEDEDENGSKITEEEEDAPVVSTVQRISTVSRVASLIRSVLPRRSSSRIGDSTMTNEDHAELYSEEREESIGSRISRYGTRGNIEMSNNDGSVGGELTSSGDRSSNGSSVALFS